MSTSLPTRAFITSRDLNSGKISKAANLESLNSDDFDNIEMSMAYRADSVPHDPLLGKILHLIWYTRVTIVLTKWLTSPLFPNAVCNLNYVLKVLCCTSWLYYHNWNNIETGKGKNMRELWFLSNIEVDHNSESWQLFLVMIVPKSLFLCNGNNFSAKWKTFSGQKRSSWYSTYTPLGKKNWHDACLHQNGFLRWVSQNKGRVLTTLKYSDAACASINYWWNESILNSSSFKWDS